jgi:hypothetical protein
MRDIARRSDHLSEFDGCDRPLANQLRQLAKGYQSRAILALVERYLDGRLVP